MNNTNTTVLVAAVVVILAVLGFGVYKLKSKKAVRFRTDEGRYKEDKWFVENYIQKKDWEMLESMLDSSTRDFPDLIEKIENALSNREDK